MHGRSIMRMVNFEFLRHQLDDLAEQIAFGNVTQIELAARSLAEDLEKYASPIQPAYGTGAVRMPSIAGDHRSEVCREMARCIRGARRNYQNMEIAAYYVREASRIFRNSEIYPDSSA